MGMAYPQYELPDSVISTILALVDTVKKENFPANKLDQITARPLRPDEINVAFTPVTRVYSSTLAGKVYERILGAAADLQVRTGSVYVILGWIVVDNPAATLGLDSVAQILVEGVIRNEVASLLVNQMENNALLTLDQVIVAVEDTTITIQVKSPTTGAGANAIVYPLAYRIGPKAQLDVT